MNSLSGTALEATVRNRATDIGPYGFGYLNIPQSNYSNPASLMDRKNSPSTTLLLDVLRVKISHPDNISMPFIESANIDGAFESVYPTKTTETDGANSVWFYDFIVKDSAKLNGYFSVINNSSEKSNFKVMNVGPTCDQGSTDKYLYSKVLNGQQYNHCTSCNVDDNFYHYYPDESPRVCTFCNEDLGYQWSEERKECDTCDINNPANHYEPSTGNCYECDESIPTNHYFSDNHQCLSCNTAIGGQIYNPGAGQSRKCVFCPNGTLRADGTCDFPPAKITYTKTMYDPSSNGVCTGTYRSGLGWRHCSISAHCEGGTFYSYYTDKSFSMYEGSVYCDWGTTEPVYYSEGIGETAIECKNPEGEVTTETITCP